jgi:nicotinamide/nicotinate riboside kinase
MIIGIGGVSTAGKTTTANKIRRLFGDLSVAIVCQDDFVKPVENIPLVRDRVDWEHPDSVNHEKLLSTILAERKSSDIVVAEGLMIFYHKAIASLFDKKIFISIDYETFRRRKGIDNRWGYEPDWYIEHIWESYQKYGQLPQSTDFLTIDGSSHNQDVELMKYLKK